MGRKKEKKKWKKKNRNEIAGDSGLPHTFQNKDMKVATLWGDFCYWIWEISTASLSSIAKKDQTFKIPSVTEYSPFLQWKSL